MPTYKFEANSTFQEIANGACDLTLNAELKHSIIYVGNSAPTSTSNTFPFKCVAGENYLSISLSSDDRLFVKSIGQQSRISLITNRQLSPLNGPTNITISNQQVTTNNTIIGTLSMIGGTPPATFVVISVEGV